MVDEMREMLWPEPGFPMEKIAPPGLIAEQEVNEDELMVRLPPFPENQIAPPVLPARQLVKAEETMVAPFS